MSFDIKSIEKKDEWDVFIDSHCEYTFLQSWSWGEFQKVTGNTIKRLGVYEKNGILVSVALLVIIRARRGNFIFCPHGPILKSPISEDKQAVISALLLEFIRIGKQQDLDFVRVSPLLENSHENRDIFVKQGFKDAPIHMMHPELGWIVNVNREDEELLAQMRKTTRHAVRKAIKDGVKVRKGTGPDDLQSFIGLYEKTFSRQQFTPFSKEYLQKQVEIFKKNGQIEIFTASYEGQDVASAVIVYSKNSGFYHHGASYYGEKKLTAAQLVQYEAILEAKKRGCTYYNFWGVVHEENKGHPWYGLSIFKRGFGGFCQEYVHAQDYKLRSKYLLNYIVEKIRTKKRGLS